MKIYIFKNNNPESIKIYDDILNKACHYGIEICDTYDESVDYIFCIGGDGTFLSCVHKCRFPSAPILGINTGHLGFFQEISSDEIDKLFVNTDFDDFTIQTFKPVEANIITDRETYKRVGINEVLIRGPYSHVTQLTVSIGNTVIQNFSGDGILISTPIGSTAYNYSLGGSIVSQDLDVLQLTPVAPMNTNAYRSFHSSIIIPANDIIYLEGFKRSRNGCFLVSFDGKTHEFNNVKRIEIEQSDKKINILRYNNYDYWKKLKSKLI